MLLQLDYWEPFLVLELDYDMVMFIAQLSAPLLEDSFPKLKVNEEVHSHISVKTQIQIAS